MNEERFRDIHILIQKGRPAKGNLVEDLLILVHPPIFQRNLLAYGRELTLLGKELGETTGFNRFGSGLFADSFSHRIILSYALDLQSRLLDQYPLFGVQYTQILCDAIETTFPIRVNSMESPAKLTAETDRKDEEESTEEVGRIRQGINELFDRIIGANQRHRQEYYLAVSNSASALGSAFCRPTLDLVQVKSLTNYYSRLVKTFQD